MDQCVEISNLVNCTLRRLTSFSGTLLHDTMDIEANVCANACVDVFMYVRTCVHPNVRRTDMRQDLCRCDVRFVSKYSKFKRFFQHILQDTSLLTHVSFPTHDPVLKKHQVLWDPDPCSKSWSTKILHQSTAIKSNCSSVFQKLFGNHPGPVKKHPPIYIMSMLMSKNSLWLLFCLSP